MITTSLHGNNRLIRKTIMQMLPSSFATVITVSVTLMIDTLLSGALLGRQAIATVAIGTPVISIFQAFSTFSTKLFTKLFTRHNSGRRTACDS